MTDKQLSINDIINATDTVIERVNIPEWGGYVNIQSMTAEGRDAYEDSIFKRVEDESGNIDFQRDFSNARAKLISACVIDSKGDRMFKTQEHVKLLGQKNSKVVTRLFEECQRINAIADKDIEELVGK